jgi:hypothetical protein
MIIFTNGKRFGLPTNITWMIKSRSMRWAGHVARMVEKPEGKRHYERPWLKWENNIKLDLQEASWGSHELIWLGIRAGGGLLWTRGWTSGYRKMRGIFWLPENRLDSEEGLWSTQLARRFGVERNTSEGRKGHTPERVDSLRHRSVVLVYVWS